MNKETYQIVALVGNRQGDTPLQNRQARGYPPATQTGGWTHIHRTDSCRGTHPYRTDSEQTPGLITCCRTRWGKKAKMY